MQLSFKVWQEVYKNHQKQFTILAFAELWSSNILPQFNFEIDVVDLDLVVGLAQF